MAKKEVHTVKTPSGWANKLPGGKVLSNHRKKETARAAGRREAIKRQAEHVIHKVDGSIGEKNSERPAAQQGVITRLSYSRSPKHLAGLS